MYTEELASAASKGFDTLWNNMSGSDQKSLEAVHGIQRGLQCCGRNSPADWLALPPPQNVIPASCCADGATICTQPNAFTKGCGQLLFDTVNSSGMLIAWIAIVFGAFEVRLDLLSHDKKTENKILSSSSSSACGRYFRMLLGQQYSKRDATTVRLKNCA